MKKLSPNTEILKDKKVGEKLKIFIKVVEKISSLFGIFAGIIMSICTLMIITEVILRYFFSSTLYITTEYMGYFMVAITFFGLAITLKDKGHIRIVFLQNLIKSKNKLFYLDMYSFIVGFLISILIFIATWKIFWNSLILGSQSTQISNTLLAIPQFPLVIGSFMLVLQFIAEILKAIVQKNDKTKEDVNFNQMLGR